MRKNVWRARRLTRWLLSYAHSEGRRDKKPLRSFCDNASRQTQSARDGARKVGFVVGHEQDRPVGRQALIDPLARSFDGRGVECLERLVEDEKRWFLDQRPDEKDDPLLAGG